MKLFGKSRISGAALEIILSALCILLAVLLLFVEGMEIKTLCYVFCGVLLAGGIVAIAYFFFTGAYKKLDDYNFALGTAMLILGVCGIIRVDALVSSFKLCMGFLVLTCGILSLQNTVQLWVVREKLWICLLVFTLVTLFGAVSVIMDIAAIWNALTYWILIVGGGLTLLGLIITSILLHRNAKREAAAAQDDET